VPEPDDAARLALARARDAAREKGLVPGQPGTRRRRPPSGHAPEVVHGQGRDPRPVGDAVEQLTAQLGWNRSLQVGGVVGRWRDVVGDRVADHCVPETFDEGALVLRADSTAWATQIRLLLPQLERRLAEEVGEGAVTSIQVLGPGGPTWRKGPRSVPGRGPRDTYG
jgi:predicted nucleic acid-binding Zn ribbon protein